MSALLFSCQLCLVACSSAEAKPQPAAKAAHESAAPPLAGYEHHASGRLVAIGDLHGDLSVTRKVLQSAGAIDAHDHWNGGKLIVVQTGDTIDRGDDDRAVIDLLERLRGEAQRAGGELVAMSGNHEIMNVSGDLRYVTQASAAAFEQGRALAFAPGGQYARVLASWPVITKVDRSVFVHGGVLPQHVRYGITRIDDEVAAWMRGERSLPAIMQQEDAPVWTRLYSSAESEVPAEVCAQLANVLHDLRADRMVVGHTPQTHGISSACDGKVWRIDTGLSHFYGGPLQWLKIAGDQVSVGASD